MILKVFSRAAMFASCVGLTGCWWALNAPAWLILFGVLASVLSGAGVVREIRRAE